LRKSQQPNDVGDDNQDDHANPHPEGDEAMRHELRSVLPGYGVAGVSTALATLAQFPLRPLVGSQHPYSFFYVAVMVTAWYGGLRRALLALTLGALSANYFFLPPENSLAITGAANQIGLALYFLVALVGTLLIEALRQQRPAVELAQPQAAFRAREPAASAAAEEAQRPLTGAPQGARALANHLSAVREELARAHEEVRRQRDEIDQLTEVLQRRPGRGASRGAGEPLPRLPICGAHSVVLLRIAEIDYAEWRNRQVFVRTGRGEHPTSYTLADLEALLPAEIFFRVHDSYLVNLDRIRDLVFLGSDSHEIRLSDGQRLPVGRGRCPELRRRLGLDDDLSL
jgi:DNA-binding LytR/AlgR family response regulator